MIPTIVYGFSKVFIRKIIFGLAIVLLAAWQLYIPRNHVTSFHHAEKRLIINMDKMMDDLLAADTTDFSLAVSTIGVVGYRLIGHDVIDLLGLTDSTIARHPAPPVEELSSTWKETKYNSKYVLTRQPKYILFSTGLKPSAPAERELFLYSQFLNSYKTVGFFFDGSLNDVYKLFYPITGPIVRDVDPEFVQAYNLAINQKARKKYPEAVANFEKAWRLSPVPKYQYIKYHMAYLVWLNGDLDTYYKILKEIESSDTLIYYAYKDLYLYEMNVLHDTEAAKRYRDKLRSLVPWYVPRLDSMILKYQQSQHRKVLRDG